MSALLVPPGTPPRAEDEYRNDQQWPDGGSVVADQPGATCGDDGANRNAGHHEQGRETHPVARRLQRIAGDWF